MGRELAMNKGLNILISTGYTQLNEINRVFEGHECVVNTRLMSGVSLSKCTGNRVMPIILLGHANPGAFKVHEALRCTGQEVISRLTRRGLHFDRYGFIFLAGCNGAAGNLYQDIANSSQLPTLASTTEVNMAKTQDRVTFNPIGGRWEIFNPSNAQIYSLDDASYAWVRHPLNMMGITLAP